MVFFALCRTYSRGALLGTAAGLGLLFLEPAGPNRSARGKGSSWPNLAWCCLIYCIGCIILTGAFGRLAPGYLRRDRSFLNRFSLLLTSAQTFAASPWRGWGSNNGVIVRENWFFPGDGPHSRAITDFFLQGAIDHGAGWMTLLVFVPLVALLGQILALISRRNGAGPDGTSRAGDLRSYGAAAGLLWIVVAGANSGRAISLLAPLVYVPATASSFRLMAPLSWRSRIGLGGTALGASAAIVGLAAWSGAAANRGLPFVIHRVTGGNLAAQVRSQGAPRRCIYAEVDETALGPFPGTRLQSVLLGLPPDVVLLTPINSRTASLPPRAANLRIGLGRLARGPAASPMLLVAPAMAPPASMPVPVRTALLLPEIDETGLNPSWNRWAQAHGANVMILPACGATIGATALERVREAIVNLIENAP
ncbi:MAG TPA: hypothetical protein VHV47_02235 [Opitutaceae bacterium]|nr:hypothetical protein [Opitutaceae bacterium]